MNHLKSPNWPPPLRHLHFLPEFAVLHRDDYHHYHPSNHSLVEEEEEKPRSYPQTISAMLPALQLANPLVFDLIGTILHID